MSTSIPDRGSRRLPGGTRNGQTIPTGSLRMARTNATNRNDKASAKIRCGGRLVCPGDSRAFEAGAGGDGQVRLDITQTPSGVELWCGQELTARPGVQIMRPAVGSRLARNTGTV